MCTCIEFLIQVPKQENAHVSFPVGMVIDSNQESPRQTKPKKGPKRKVHEVRPFL